MNKRLSDFLKNWWLLILSYIIILTFSMRLQPIGDDWFFLKYFPQISRWQCVNEYHWLNGNILLPRDYWRPIEDMMYTLQTHFPVSFPYLNHFMAVTCAFIAVAGICYLGCRHLLIRPRIMGLVCGVLIWMPNNMGALLSIDSITMTSATMFGIMSIIAYNENRFRAPLRYCLWLMFGLLACFSKENGVVCFVLGTVFSLVVEFSRKMRISLKDIFSWHVWKLILMGLIPSIIYLSCYVYLKDSNKDNIAYQHSIEVTASAPSSVQDVFTSSQESHKLTPATVVKNIFIEYGAGFYPVDTCAIYYKDYGLLAISGILSLSGIILLVMIVRQTSLKWRSPLMWGILLMALIASAPSMVTRAGEISPFISNMFLFLWVAVMMRDVTMSKNMFILLGIYWVSALMTDIHKYQIAYTNGMETRRLAICIKESTPKVQSNVLLITRDDEALDPGGGAFNKSLYKGFHSGAAAVREFDYQGPSRLSVMKISSEDWDMKKDSLVNVARTAYDYIWVVAGNDYSVIATRP